MGNEEQRLLASWGKTMEHANKLEVMVREAYLLLTSEPEADAKITCDTWKKRVKKYLKDLD